MIRLTGYGDVLDFPTLQEAQAAVRACGGDFAATVLRLTGRTRADDAHVRYRIVDERGDHVGYVYDDSLSSSEVP